MRVKLIDLLKEHEMTVSSSNARRLVAMGTVRLNGILQTDMAAEVEVNPGDVLEVGRKKVVIQGGFTPPTAPAKIAPANFD